MNALLRRAASRLVHLPFIDLQRERLALRRQQSASCDSRLLSAGWDKARVDNIMTSPTIAAEWPRISAEIAALGVTERAAGVNPGDRRAVYHLVRSLAPLAVLEVGTHVGASTVHMAVALRENRAATGSSVQMTTVDVENVNDAAVKPWTKYGSTHSPGELIARVGMNSFVQFLTVRSLNHLANCRERYDLIFLDGDHAAQTVYREIPLALNVLKKGGVILLHDYFPDGRPLWLGSRVIPGPWLAIERLRSEGAQLKVLPVGRLPWPTKSSSDITSLALLAATDGR